MRRFVETNRGEAVGGGGFRAFAPSGRYCQLEPISFAMMQALHG